MPQQKHAYSSRPPLARMLHIHTHLLHNTYPNCQKLARELEVSYKTIQRDIDFMRDRLTLPIQYDPSKYGFYYTQKVTSFPTLQVTEGEVLALFIAQKALLQYKGTPFEKTLHNAFHKLSQSLTEHVDFQLSNLDATFSFRTLGTPISDLKLFKTLSDAIQKSVQIKFQYLKLEGTRYQNRLVQPYHLSCVDNIWYLFAYDLNRKDLRTFALTRMKKLQTTTVRFERPKDFNPSRLLQKSFGVFGGDKQHHIRILFDPFASRLVQEKLWHPTQQIIHHKNHTLELRMTVNSLHEIERWILSWREHAIVLSPPILRQKILKTISSLQKTYTSSKPAFPKNTAD